MNAEAYFEPADDYQKAKRAAFGVALISSLLATAPSTGSGTNTDVPTAVIFGISLKHGLHFLLVICLLSSGYCLYNFYIQQRRAHIKHCKMMEKFKDLEPEAALLTLEESLKSMASAAETVKKDIAEFHRNVRSLEIPDVSGDPSFSTEKYIDEYRVKYEMVIKTIKDNDPHNTTENLTNFFGAILNFIENDFKMRIQAQIGQQVHMLSNNWDIATRDGQKALSEAVDQKIPALLNTASELSGDINAVSDSIGRIEQRFFIFERGFVYFALVTGLILTSCRLFAIGFTATMAFIQG